MNPLRRKVTVQCTGCGRDIQRHLNGNEFWWCEDCSRDRKRELDRQSYWRNIERTRRRKRANDYRRYGRRRQYEYCVICQEPVGWHCYKYCEKHSAESNHINSAAKRKQWLEQHLQVQD